MSDKKKDLTRIEDLSEYLHQLDPEADKIFEETKRKIETENITVSTDTGSITAETLEEESTETELETDSFSDSTDPDTSFESEETDFSSDETNFESSENDFSDTDKEKDEETTDFSSDFEESTDFEEEKKEENSDSLSFEQNDEIEETIEESTALEEPEENTPELTPENEPAPIEKEITPKPEVVSSKEIQAPAAETFEDVRAFAQNISYTSIASGGNPPYSIMLKSIRFTEDTEEISTILEKYGILTDSSRKEIEQGLQSGALLISQISEYSAIFLAHKLRRFDLQISVGLSDELHPSQSYASDNTGLVGKESIHQNHQEEINLEGAPTSFESVLVATTPTLENYQIIKYIDVATEHSTIDEIDLREDQDNLPKIYQVMAEKLKKQTLSLKGNAVVGLNYQITPLPLQQYKISCSGNIVWVARRGEQVE